MTAQRPRCCWKPKQQLCVQKRYQSSLSKRSTKGEGERGEEKKRRQSGWLANQIDRKVIDRQVEDKTDGSKNRPMSVYLVACTSWRIPHRRASHGRVPRKRACHRGDSST